ENGSLLGKPREEVHVEEVVPSHNLFPDDRRRSRICGVFLRGPKLPEDELTALFVEPRLSVDGQWKEPRPLELLDDVAIRRWHPSGPREQSCLREGIRKSA